MAWLDEIRKIFREEVSLAELTDPSLAGARLRQGLLLVRETARSIQRHQSLTLASALAYQTLVAMIPLMAISLAVVAMLQSPEVSSASNKTYIDHFQHAILQNIPDFAGRTEFLDSIRQFAANARAIAGIGFVFLFGAVFSLLGRMEFSFNTIWQVREMRPLLGRLNAYIATIIIVPLLMTMSVYFTEKFVGVAEQIAERLPSIEALEAFSSSDKTSGDTDATGTQRAPGDAGATQPSSTPDSGTTATTLPTPAATETKTNNTLAAGTPPPASPGHPQSMFVKIMLAMASLLTSCLAMMALYYLLPYTPVRWKAALAGGVFSGVLFEIAKFLFRYYAAYLSVNYTRIYGPLLAVPLLLLWIWLAWVIVLIGAEIAFTSENFRDLAARAELEKRGIASRLYLAIRITLFACESFHAGEEPRQLAERIADTLKLPLYCVREMVSLLVEGNVLRRTQTGENGLLPARDISVMTLQDVVNAVSADTLDVPERPDDTIRQVIAERFGKMRQARQDILGAITFADLVNESLSGDSAFFRDEPDDTTATPLATPDTTDREDS